ncbi:MAG: inositol monophosphatase [Nanoarchaeota archaeon]|nr:inositol monophosphatase [Nanoarchaeota archaeon]
MTETRKFAISIIKRSGRYLLDNFRYDSNLLTKRSLAKEITTKYDKRSNKIIIYAISRNFPTHNVVSEESNFIDNKSEFTWIIDPLDGSSNFANGNPFFSISIALMKKNELLLGVIFAPFLDELYVAEKNKGAYLNGKKIHVSKIDNLKNSYFLSCEGGDKSNKRIAEINHMFHGSLRDLRKLGSAALESAHVASGKAESYIVTKINSWDIAAGVLLVKEAGGNVSDFKGEEWTPNKYDLVFSNGKLHQKILSILKKHMKNKKK